LPLHHVEAGLRSHDMTQPWPEELIRVEISQTATWHYAPTQTSRANLVLEGVPDDHIVVTGNSVVSALARYAPSDHSPTVTPDTILITMHRREARGHLEDCFDAAKDWLKSHPSARIWWIMHPSAHLDAFAPRPAHFTTVHPANYRDMLWMLRSSIGIATDSGGLQEEAAALGVPCAVLRTVSDRPESIVAGVAKLYTPSAIGITAALDALWAREIPRRASNCYGDRNSAFRIADSVAKRLTMAHFSR
jgi:UDP-N-acetylglucosamine 2-epimerase (non-hydrolysing)